MGDWLLNALWSITPTIIIGAMFGGIIWAALNADRKVRRDRAQVEREERERMGLPPRESGAAREGAAN